MFKFLRYCGDLRPDLRTDVAFDEVVDLIEPCHRADSLARKIDGGVDEQLLGQLDDGAVRAAHVFARAALCPKPRNDLDDQINLIWQQRVEIYETVKRELLPIYIGHVK